jgi:hypothetical protein
VNLLHLIFRINPPNVAASSNDPAYDERMAALEKTLEDNRAELRQKVQKAQSGSRILKTWAGAMEMTRSNGRGQTI